MTSIWAGEYRSDVLDAPEAAVADAVVLLRSEQVGQRRLRFVEVLKIRGSGFLSGSHGYRLSSRGIDVFARLADPVDLSAIRVEDGRVSLGSDALDAMTSGGVWRGTSTLVMGPSGIGKTILGLDFLTRAAESGQAGVFATLQESRTQMGRVLWSEERPAFDGRITFHHRSPVDIYIDEWAGELLRLIESVSAEVLVIDSLSDLRLAAPDDKRFEEFMYSLSQRLSQHQITTLMTLESAPVFGLAQVPATALSNLADNLILLGYEYEAGRVTRVIHVLKSRASDHDPMVRHLTITGAGLVVGEPLSS